MVVVPAGARAPPDGATCAANADAVTCLVGDDPTFRCGLVQPDGTYQVRGLVHGGYTVLVLPSDPEYITPAPFDLQRGDWAATPATTRCSTGWGGSR